MSAAASINTLRVAKGQLPPTDPLGRVLTELLATHDTGTIIYVLNPGAANAAPIYKQNNNVWETWGAFVNFKAGNMPSFVHELTHARCCHAFKANMLNYQPKRAAVTMLPMTMSNGPIHATAPNDSRFCLNEVARRQAWHDADVVAFYTNNLDNLGAWADATDFNAANIWVDKRQQQELEGLQKLVKSGKATQQHLNKLLALQGEQTEYGVLIQPKKKNDRTNAVQTEGARKKAYIKERIAYGKIGQGGMGDVHFEYDTVINQMLYQMYLWGFRPSTPWKPSLLVLAHEAREGKVPAAYFYGLLEQLALDAHARRMAAAQIPNGTNPVITTPPVLINPPPVNN